MGVLSRLLSPLVLLTSFVAGYGVVVEHGVLDSHSLSSHEYGAQNLVESSVVAYESDGEFKVKVKTHAFAATGSYSLSVGIASGANNGITGDIHADSKGVSIKKCCTLPCQGSDTFASVAEGASLSCPGTDGVDVEFHVRFDRQSTDFGYLKSKITIVGTCDNNQCDYDDQSEVIELRQEYHAATATVAAADVTGVASVAAAQTTGASKDIEVAATYVLTHDTFRTPSDTYVTGLSASDVAFELLSLSRVGTYSNWYTGAQDLTGSASGTRSVTDDGCAAEGRCPVKFSYALTKTYDLGIAKPLAKYFTNDGGCGGDCRGGIKATYDGEAASTNGFNFAATATYSVVSGLTTTKIAAPATAEKMITDYSSPSLSQLFENFGTSSSDLDLDGTIQWTAPVTSGANAALSAISGCDSDASPVALSTFADLAAANAHLTSKRDACTFTQPSHVSKGVTIDFAGVTSNAYYFNVGDPSTYIRDYSNVGPETEVGQLSDDLAPAADAAKAWASTSPTCAASVTLSGTHEGDAQPVVTCAAGAVFTLADAQLDLSVQDSGNTCDSAASGASCSMGDYGDRQCFEATVSGSILVSADCTGDDSRIDAACGSASVTATHTKARDAALVSGDVSYSAASTAAATHGDSNAASHDVAVTLNGVEVTESFGGVAAAMNYNCEAAGEDKSYTKSIVEPCGANDNGPFALTHTITHRVQFSAGQKALTESEHGGAAVWTVGEKALYTASANSGAGVTLKIKVAGTAADYLLGTGASRVHISAKDANSWAVCDESDGGKHVCTFQFAKDDLANMAGDAADQDINVEFDLGLETADCAAGAAAQVAAITKMGLSRTLTLTVTADPDPFRGAIRVYDDQPTPGLLGSRAEETAAHPETTVSIALSKGVTTGPWEPTVVQYQFDNPDASALTYTVKITGGKKFGTEDTETSVNLPGDGTGTVKLEITDTNVCVNENDDAYPNLGVELIPQDAQGNDLTPQARTINLHVNCIAEAATLKLLSDDAIDGDCDTVAAECKDVSTLDSNVLGDAWIARQDIESVTLRFKQFGTGLTSNTLKVSVSGSNPLVEQTTTISDAAASVTIDLPSACVGNQKLDILMEQGDFADITGSIQVRCVRQGTAASDTLHLDYSIGSIGLSLASSADGGGQTLQLAATPASLDSSTAFLGHRGGAHKCDGSAADASCDLSGDPLALKAALSSEDANAFFNALEVCGATTEDTATELVREIDVVRTFTREIHGHTGVNAITYCEERRIRYEIISTDTATLTVAIASPQSREFRVHVQDLEYQSCDAGSGADTGYKMVMNLDLEMDDGSGYGQFAISASTSDFEDVGANSQKAMSVSPHAAFSSHAAAVGNLVFESACHAIATSTCGTGAGDEFRTDALASSFALVDTHDGQQYAASVSISSQISCPLTTTEQSGTDEISASITHRCDSAGGTGYGACGASISAEASIEFVFADTSDWTGAVNIDAGFPTLAYGATTLDLSSLNAENEANLKVNGQLIVSADKKTVQVMALPMQGQDATISFAYTRANNRRMLRTYVLSSDGDVSSTVTILPATTEVTDQALIDPPRSPSSGGGTILDGLSDDGHAYVHFLQGLLIAIGVLFVVMLGVGYGLNCRKNEGVAKLVPFRVGSPVGSPVVGVRQEAVGEGTPLFSRFKHEI